jgi:hypothetical protein
MHTIQDNSVDVAGICQTWFNESCNPATAIIKYFGYSIIHNFRKEKKGGRTALIFKSSYNLFLISFSHTFFEITAATTKTDQSKFLFVVIYQTGPLSSKFLQELDILLADLCSRVDAFILSRDFNIHFELSSTNRMINQALELMHHMASKNLWIYLHMSVVLLWTRSLSSP